MKMNNPCVWICILFCGVNYIYVASQTTEVKLTRLERLYQKQCLLTHNDIRWRHSAPPLKLNATLNKLAKELVGRMGARFLRIGSGVSKSLEYLNDTTIGQNVGGLENSAPYFPGFYQFLHVDGEYPPRAWYRELRRYDFSHPGFQRIYGHFTQMVWVETTDIGVSSIVVRKDGEFFVAILYYPAGNVATVEDFIRNVKPPIYGEMNGLPSNYSRNIDFKPLLINENSQSLSR